MRRDVYQAIADPTRREIIHFLSSQSLNLNALADRFLISRPAISRHIKILVECKLIEIRQEGRERHCVARLEALNEVSKWLDQYKIFWANKLDALELHLGKQNKTKQKK